MSRRVAVRSRRWTPEQVRLGCMLLLTFSTGVADAVGYLGLDRVFTGNMTGNVVILGMAVSGAEDLPVVGPSIALLAFLTGAALGGRALRTSGTGWSGTTTWLLLVVATAFAGCGAFLAVGQAPPGSTAGFVVTGIVAMGMGVQAAAARAVGVKDVTTVVVTSTLTGLAADSRLAGGAGQQWARRAGAVVLIGAGACAGALLLRVDLSAGMAASAVLTVVVAIWGHARGRVGQVVAASPS
ncbi:YoaK family protein [Aeromicrobium endophyticum]|uniref:DUF1275 domain-containing protein n=1 Tax=Aeromicrobium endophyticum TaxID=2292704 RepID=A0A371PAV3_9ACTN|nr:YoaK family protein [Aeromicrobium endophyticum]REK73084.1 DUF1275 domain-containing protein [Aeromicrobium endophyticum]